MCERGVDKVCECGRGGGRERGGKKDGVKERRSEVERSIPCAEESDVLVSIADVVHLQPANIFVIANVTT